jgi:transposase
MPTSTACRTTWCKSWWKFAPHPLPWRSFTGANVWHPIGAAAAEGHRPKNHQAHLEWTPSRIVHWAEQIGPHTARLFERILADKPHPEMGYRSCLGIIRLAEHYSASRMEAAAQRAVETGACRYQSVKSILKNSLDQQPGTEPLSPLPAAPTHDNIRGAEYFE